MRKTAVLLVVFGFLFVFFRVEFSGIDLLMDAAGYIVIFNGVRALGKVYGNFRIAPALCLVLVAVTAVQIFLSGIPLMVISILRASAETALFCMMSEGFLSLAKRLRHPAPGVCALVLFLLCALASIAAALATAPYFAAIDFFRGFTFGFSVAAHGLLCAALAVFAFLPEPAGTPAAPPEGSN